MEAINTGKTYYSVLQSTYDVASPEFAFELEQQIRAKDYQSGFRRGLMWGVAMGVAGSLPLVIYLGSLILWL